MPEVFAWVELSEKFGWTLDQILDQPDWYIEAIYSKLRIDAARRKLGK